MANKNILLITANSEISHFFSDLVFRPAENQISLAKDVRSAETTFRSNPPDLVILDASIEDGTGVEYAKRIVELLPNIPIILISDKDRINSLELAIEVGAVDSICHPLDTEPILISVERALKRREQLEKWARQHSLQDTDNLRLRLNVLERLHQVEQSVTSSLDLDHILTLVVDSAVEVTDAEEGSLLMIDEETGDLYMRAACNFQNEFVRTFRLPIEESLAGEVIRTGRPVTLEGDTPQKINTAYLVRSLLYVPLRIHNRIIGVLGVDNRSSSQPFLEEHLTLVSALADHAAIAIENTQLYEDTEIERKNSEAILEGIGDGVIVVDNDLRVYWVNRSAAEAFNVLDSNVINQPIEQVFDHEDLVEMLHADDLEYPNRCELTLDDGRIMNALLTKIPEVGLVVTMQDITHLKELDRIKSDFVNTVSHDLRSPLTAILGYVDLITRVGPINNKQDEFIKRVQESVRNITSLINDLLELGRIESGFDARKDFVPLAATIQYSINSFGSSIMEKNQKILVDAPENVDKVFGNPTRLRQLVDNLLGNAIRYTPKGGQIRISLKSEKNQIIFQVQDTGPGIPPSDQPYIFDKFYRASNIEKQIPGSGLGLAIVKTIVDNHQGRVWVESTLGHGSTFTVVLPTAGDHL